MQYRSALVGGAVVGALVFGPGIADANGRFPAAMHLVEDPSDPNHLVVQATFGFISTVDGGERWGWTCEDAANYQGIFDPPVAVTQSGTVLTGVFDGLVVSADACSYAFAEGPGGALLDRFVTDLSVQKDNPSKAIAISTNTVAGAPLTQVWESPDNGANWTQMGVDLPQPFIGYTLDAAPSNDSVIYASGIDANPDNAFEGRVIRSMDRGQTWTSLPVPNTSVITTEADEILTPFLGAVHPTRPNELYVRVSGEPGVLLRSTDAGDNWETIFTGVGTLKGFALSPDGTRIAVGGELDGIWMGPSDGSDFTKRSEIAALCLTWTPSALYACAIESLDDFTIGRSVDEGATFEPIYTLSCLDGPLDCPDDTSVGSKCPSVWPILAATIETKNCDDAGDGGGGSSPTPPSSDGSEGGGCCTVARPGPSGTPAVMASLLALGLARWRRRAKIR